MSQEERLLILQMVADQKISATEAAELLRALNDGQKAPAPPARPVPPAAPPAPPAPGAPPAPQAGPAPAGPEPVIQSSGVSFASGLSSFIEEVVSRVTSAVSEFAEPPYEFPSEFTGLFTEAEVPVRIVTGNGAVRVQTWDQPGYKALVRVKARGTSEADARNRAQDAFTVSADERGFHLETRRYDWQNMAVHVTLLVPGDRLYKVEVKTGNGDVELTDLPVAEGRVSTGNGKVVSRGGQQGRLDLRTGNGSLLVESDAADVEASSGNGSVTIRPVGSRSKRLRVNTGNGSVRIDTRQVPAGTGFRVDAHTAMGGVDIGLPGLVFERDVRSVGHKHVVAHSSGYEQATQRIEIKAGTGMGSIGIE